MLDSAETTWMQVKAAVVVSEGTKQKVTISLKRKGMRKKKHIGKNYDPIHIVIFPILKPL